MVIIIMFMSNMRRIGLLAFLPIFFTSISCDQKNSVINEKAQAFDFEARFAESETRTYVDEGLHLFWTKGDKISVFSNTMNTEYVFNGETGDNSGTFSKIPSSEFSTGSSLNSHYAIYPFHPETTIDYDGRITISLPAHQEYVRNSFGLNANVMTAVTENEDDRFLFFKNVCGYLKINLYGNIMVRKIQLKGNKNEPLSGRFRVLASNANDPSIEALSGNQTTITLDCPESGVALGSSVESATPFWLVVPPTQFENGFEITITDTEGNEYSKKTTQAQSITRNVCLSMPAITLNNGTQNEPTDLGDGGYYNCFIVSSKGYYRFSVGSRIGDSAFLLWNENGAKDISNVYYNDGYVYFKKNQFDKGNAVISVSDNGTIVWSWHIWTTDYPQVVDVNGVKWMDRNLGATSIEAGNEDTYGMSFNPGNPFPFPGPKYSEYSITEEPSVPDGWYVADGYGYYLASNMPKPSSPMQLCTNTDTFGNSVYFRSRYNQFPEGFYLPSYGMLLGLLTYEPTIVDNGVYPAEGLYLPCIYGNSVTDGYGRYLCSGVYNTTAVDTYAVYFYDGMAKMTYCQGAALMPVRGYSY